MNKKSRKKKMKKKNAKKRRRKNADQQIWFINSDKMVICKFSDSVELTKHEFHDTCHSVTLIVLVNSHQR